MSSDTNWHGSWTKSTQRGIYSCHYSTSVVLFVLLLVQSGMLRYEMSETGTSLAGTEKRAGPLWQMARQSVGQPIDWASSGCDLCLPFLSHLKGEVSGSDRVMYKSSTWLVTPRWALYLPSSLSPRKKLHRQTWYLMWNDWEGYTVLDCGAKNQHEYNNPLNAD